MFPVVDCRRLRSDRRCSSKKGTDVRLVPDGLDVGGSSFDGTGRSRKCKNQGFMVPVRTTFEAAALPRVLRHPVTGEISSSNL